MLTLLLSNSVLQVLFVSVLMVLGCLINAFKMTLNGFVGAECCWCPHPHQHHHQNAHVNAAGRYAYTCTHQAVVLRDGDAKDDAQTLSRKKIVFKTLLAMDAADWETVHTK